MEFLNKIEQKEKREEYYKTMERLKTNTYFFQGMKHRMLETNVDSCCVVSNPCLKAKFDMTLVQNRIFRLLPKGNTTLIFQLKRAFT